MSSLSTKKTEPELSESQRNALITLLDDEDPGVYEAVRGKILSYGPQVIRWLQPHLRSESELLRRRAKAIVDHFAQQDADTDFLAFCLKQGEEFDLEQGIWKLVKTQFPNVNAAAYTAILDGYANELRVRLEGITEPEETIAIINEYLFDDLGFAGNEENYYEPENSYLNQVLDRRTGNPISLCVVYMLIARRLKLPIAGIGLPGHFICRFQGNTEELYIDVFNLGKLLTKADCIKYLLHTNHTLEEGYLIPVSSRRILLRICANLHQIYTQLEQAEQVARFQRYLVALAK